jgi:chitinase
MLGGAISFLLGQQQVKEARRQREEDDAREHRRRSMDRRFAAYADFLTRARSFRNAVEAYYSRPGHGPSLAEVDALLQSANDASALVFLVMESEQTYDGCRDVLRALRSARMVIQATEPDAAADPWPDLNVLLGRATREFQNSVRKELGVSGPIAAWQGRGLPEQEQSQP